MSSLGPSGPVGQECTGDKLIVSHLLCSLLSLWYYTPSQNFIKHDFCMPALFPSLGSYADRDSQHSIIHKWDK